MDLLLNPAAHDPLVTSIKTFQSDEELLKECTNNSTNNEEDTEIIEDESEKIEKLNKKAMYEVLHLIKGYSLFQDDDIAQKLQTVWHN